MAKLSIKNFTQGQTSSPYSGDGAFWKSCNLDIHGQEGLARINYKPTGVSSSDNLMRDGFGVSLYNKIYYSEVVTSSSNGNVKYIDASAMTISDLGATKRYLDSVTWWKGRLIGTPSYRAYADLATTDNQTLAANAINTGVSETWYSLGGFLSASNYTIRPRIMTSLRDGHVYYTNNYFVGRLEQNAGSNFNPADSGTFTNTPQYMEHESQYVVESMEDFGRFLAVFCNDIVNTRTVIFLWDTSSPQVEGQFIINESKMTRTIEKHGTIYICGGKQGNIYKLSESGLSKYATINVGDYDNQNYLHKDIIFKSVAWWKDRLIVGVDVKAGSTLTPAGIYSVKEGKVNHEFIPSNGLSDHTLQLGGMLTFGDYLVYGAGNGTDNYVDYVRDDANRLSSGCYLETPLMRAGYKMQKGNIDRIEVILARPLQTGESFTFKYRRALTESYVTLATKSFTTDGAQSTFVLSGIKNIENLQLRIDFGTGATSKNTPMLQEVTLF